jgi:predicted nucleotidyltransferase
VNAGKPLPASTSAGCWRGQDTDESDLDILVDPTPETTLLDVATIQVKLQRLLGVSVDVLTPKALPDSFRNRVLSEAVPV